MEHYVDGEWEQAKPLFEKTLTMLGKKDGPS